MSDQKGSGMWSAGSFSIMVHSLANPEEVEAFLRDTLGKRIEALEAENAQLRGMIKKSFGALNSMALLGTAEQQGRDRAADKLDREISDYRQEARATLAAAESKDAR